MPLFGSKHKHDNDTALGKTTGVTGVGAADRHHQMNTHAGVNSYGTGTGTGTGMGIGTTAPGLGGVPQQDFAATNNHHQHGVGRQEGLTDPRLDGNAAYGAGGIGPTHAGGARGAGIPPTSVIDNNNHHISGGGAGQRLTGKVESAIGSRVGSNALKAKGLQKEQEANAIKLQGRELAEAERLEHEALMRRERAVAHGAHPANSTLGGGPTGMGTGAAGGTGF